jgi:hypothetical protein
MTRVENSIPKTKNEGPARRLKSNRARSSGAHERNGDCLTGSFNVTLLRKYPIHEVGSWFSRLRNHTHSLLQFFNGQSDTMFSDERRTGHYFRNHPI